MNTNFKLKKFLMKIILCVVVVNNVRAQMHAQKCTEYKKRIYEETKTFSYFLPGASEISYIEDSCKTERIPFIAGGKDALPKEFPPAARLGHMADNGYVNWFCGGTLLSETFVLTAAHCFDVPLGGLNRVRLGELDFDSDTDDASPEDFGVQQLIKHPDYNKTVPYNDIGLVMLNSKVKFDAYKQPACLPIQAPSTEMYFDAIGWGHKKFSAETSSHLQKVKLRFYSYDECRWLEDGFGGKERLPDGLKVSQFCAGSSEAKDTCQGDSGGPLLISHKVYPCMYSVIGITSLGVGGCALPNVPGIYTNVSYYIDWISEIVY